MARAAKSMGHVNRNSFKQKNKSKAIVIVLIGFIVFLILFAIINNPNDKKYFLKNAYVCNATITEKGIEDNKYYIHVSILDKIDGANINSDDLWKEVTSDFYNSHNASRNVGILLGYYDVFKDNKYSKGQTFKGNSWGIEEIYDSLDAAKSDNPQKTYTSKGKVTNKKLTKNSEAYLTLDIDERTMTAKVSQEMYNKTEIGKEVDCELEALGDLIKIKKVIE